VFVENPNHKGNVAEAAIALAAMKAGLAVSKPMTEHTRYDLVIGIGDELKRVQCKWGCLSPHGAVITVNLASSRFTPSGRVITKYASGEVDFVAVYCGALDRCYLLPERLFVDRGDVWLRLEPAKNGQRSCINLAADYEFEGAVAQLVERRAGSAQATGSSPVSSIQEPPMSIGSDEFRNRLGYYLDLAAEGQEINITRWGRRYLKLVYVGQATLRDGASPQSCSSR
jgi:PD-(D/E)XK endonuclease